MGRGEAGPASDGIRGAFFVRAEDHGPSPPDPSGIGQGIARELDRKRIEEFIAALPFPLTGAQRRVVEEILSDMAKGEQMYRLLQGDVGSGKTVVAAIVLYANYLSGYQGALMVPTEILAEQHAAPLAVYLCPGAFAS